MSKVTEDHIAQYEAEGCVKVEGVFDQVWIDRLTAAIDEAYAAFGTPAFDALATGARSQNPPTVHPGEGQVQLRNFASMCRRSGTGCGTPPPPRRSPP